MKLVILFCALLVSVSSYADYFLGSYKCSGGHMQYLKGTQTVEAGLVHFKGVGLEHNKNMDEGVLSLCSNKYMSFITCAEARSVVWLPGGEYFIDEPAECTDGEDDADDELVEVELERDWNIYEVQLSNRPVEALCSNVPYLNRYSSEVELGSAYIRGQGIITIGGQGEYDVTSGECIKYLF